ncbi:unnamed protein product [Nesidiocoris tenuis]|uniref:Uncharacterized protein n=1 Tax=Nesidiocoris tenuis TaxID=355587 RepID=A0A6H5GZY7_9HEMI|nr:unnamed protein product [Nesidiocoris tenuis]
MCKQGFDDALRFLQRNDLINCTRCLAVQSTYVISEDDDAEFDPQCQECNEHKREAMVAGMPDIVVSVFQEYIDSANKGLYNWLLAHKGMQLVALLSLPYTIPVDFAMAFIKKLRKTTPFMTTNLRSMCKFLICQMIGVLETVSSKAGYKLTATLQLEHDLGSDHDHVFDKEVNINFRIDDKSIDPERLTMSNVLSRRGSFTYSEPLVDDTYENILHVTSQHDAIMAYYYMDENNKLRVTEIFDVTDMPSDTITDDLHAWKESHVSSWVKSQAETTFMNFDDDCDDAISSNSSTSTATVQQVFSEPESDWVPRGNSKTRADKNCDDIKSAVSQIQPANPTGLISRGPPGIGKDWWAGSSRRARVRSLDTRESEPRAPAKELRTWRIPFYPVGQIRSRVTMVHVSTPNE